MRNDRTWIELSRSALQHNLAALRSMVGAQTLIAPVIKANAYGHGWPAISRLLRGSSIWGVCVAYGEEALALRRDGWRKRILVLSYWDQLELPELIRQRVDLVAWDFVSLQQIKKSAIKQRQPVNVHLKLDTGTTRIGFRPEEINQLRHLLQQRHVNTKVAGLFSHLANSEERSTVKTNIQIQRFTTLEKLLDIKQGIRHLACTAAVIRYPASRLDMVRYGIGLYGLWPSTAIQTWAGSKLPRLVLRPVLSWHSRLEQIKLVPAGTRVGYGSTFRLKRPGRIGLVPVGYSDGYDRRATNGAWVMIAGKRANVIGRVSMNLLAVDLQSVPTVKRGAQVTLLGDGASADQLAEAFGTISYEVVSRLHPGISRVITA